MRHAANAFGTRVSSTVERIAGEIRKLPEQVVPIVRGFWSEPKNFLSLGQHVAVLPVSAAQASAANSFGELPLVVLSGDHHPAPYDDWQRDLAQLSSRGLQLLAGDCGHWIHLDRPELVAEAIRQVVAATRTNLQAKSFAASGSVSDWKTR